MKVKDLPMRALTEEELRLLDRFRKEYGQSLAKLETDIRVKSERLM